MRLLNNNCCTSTVALFLLVLTTVGDRRTAAVRLCGRKLVQVLKVLCKHEYNGIPYANAAGIAFDQETAHATSYRHEAGGIVEECCHQTCSYSVLLAYCAATTTVTPPPTESTTTPSENSLLEAASSEWLQHDHHNRKALNSLDENASAAAITKGIGRPKTFRSLFHLLNYISKLLTEEHLKQKREELQLLQQR